MDRIFDTGTVEDICTQAKDVIKETKDCIRELKSIASDIQSAAGEVPLYAKKGNLSGEASSMKRALGKGSYDEVAAKLKSCQEKACSVIPQYDSMYAAQMESVTDAARKIKGIIEELREFMLENPLTTDAGKFAKVLAAKETKWKRELQQVKESLDETVANAKGAQEISTIYSKDPVNLSTGNFIYDKEDLTSGGNPPFIFRRFYNSRNRYHGVLGADWNHNYEVSLTFKESSAGEGKDVTILLEDGKEETFYPVDGRDYVPGNQSLAELTRTEEGYEYRTLAGEKYRFSKEGRYLRREDTNGEGFTLSYTENGDKTLLTEIRKDSGEFFALSYTEEGYLQTVTDHAGRSFAYEVKGGRLYRAIRPDGRSFVYEYNGNGKLIGVTNPRGITTVENEYDERDRTVSQRFPDGTKMQYEYDDEKRTVTMTERNGSRSIHYHDGKYRNIRNVYSDGEESFAYNSRNQKTKITDKLGNVTHLSYDNRGNLTGIVNALGTKLAVTYGAHNKPVSVSIDGKQKLKNIYDSKGNLLESVDALERKTAFSYNDRGLPEEVIQADGSRIRLAYDRRGNIREVTDERGGVSRYAYDGLNRVEEAEDPNGNRTKFTYDANGNILTVTNAAGDIRSYEYNESGKVTRVTDFDGNDTKWTYNALNRPEKVTDKQGRITKLTYDAMWNLARVTQPNGARTTYLYNENNRLSRIRDAMGNVIRYTYDGNGNRLSEEDALGNTTRFTYDALGRLIKACDPEGAETAYEYDNEGNLVKVTDAMGNQVFLEYDAAGQLIKETNPLGDSRSYTYNALGDIESVTDEAGRVTRYGYLPGGKLEKIQYSDGTEETYSYDAGGNVSAYTDRAGYRLCYAYDSLDRLTEIRGEDGERSSYSYDASGNVTAVTDASGNTTRYEYSPTGRLVHVTDALGNEAEYSYDENDQLTGILQRGKEPEEEPRQTEYHRNLLGQIERITDALGQQEHYRYSARGELLQKIDKEGYLTKYSYTKQGDIEHILYGDGKKAKFLYNPLRQLEKVEDWQGTTRIVNDALGRAERIVYPDGKKVCYTYGKLGERRSLTYPDGRTVYYGFDGDMRLSELKDGDKVISYEYDGAGRLSKKVFPNGTQTRYEYDKKGQLVKFIHADVQGILDQYFYQYDLLGNKIEIQKERRGFPEESGRYHYAYDGLGRLCEVEKDGFLQKSYVYDAFSNRIQMSEKGKEILYKYNALNQLVSVMEGQIEKTYLYDKRGNMNQYLENGQVKRKYLYGALNRLEQASTENGDIVQYYYNGLGHRIGKTIEGRKMNGLCLERKIQDTIDLTRQYHNLLQRDMGEKIQSYVWDKNVAAMREKETELNYYLQDDMGSPIRLIDAEGNLTEAYGYDEFGNHLFGMQAKIQPFGYTGYQYDKIAKTYYAQAREYLPTVGRFAEEDVVKGTVFAPVSFNAYAYCNNNSLLYCDLNGMWITTVVGAGVGAIFGVTTQLIGDFATSEKPSLKKCISAGIGGAVGGAVVGTTGNFGVAGAASAATSTVIQGVWDIADGTTELNAKEITKLVVRTGVNSAIGYGIGKISGILGDKLVGKSSTLKGWNFKYQYADKRIRAGSWTIIDTLKIHKLKFFAVEAVSSAPAVVADTINNVVTDWMKKITEDIHIKDIIESVKKYAITMLQDKNEVETCIVN